MTTSNGTQSILSPVPPKWDQSILDRRPPQKVPEQTIPCFDPATMMPLGQVAVQTPEEVEVIVAKAHHAQQSWKQAPFAERRKVLQTILDHVLEHADELCEMVVQDAGKTRENAMLGEIWTVCEKLRHTMAKGERYLRPERVSSGMLVHKKATIEYHPLGVIGIIAPWNYPLQNVLGPTIPALFAGNAVVIKVSEWVAWSAERIQRIFDEAFTLHGYPIDLVTVVNGYADTGAALCNAGVDKIIFTGSMANGRKVMLQCASTLTPVILELGGKDAMIVCDDAALEQAVHAAMTGVFIAAGQNCLAAERIFVFDRIYDDFVARVQALVGQLRQAPPLDHGLVDVGAMTMPQQIDIIQHLVDDAVAKGATLLAGGKRNPDHAGQFFLPTILTDVTPEMEIMQEEVFGPVMVLIRVKDEAEAIRMANDCPYGLNSTVLTRDPVRAQRIADQIVAGGTCVNDFGMTYMAQELPFGGVKGSGFGRLNGRDGLRAMCNAKAVLTDRFPLHQPAKLYPVADNSYDVAKATIKLMYSKGIGARLSALGDLIKSFRKS